MSALGKRIELEALAVAKKFGADGEPLINGAVERLKTIGHVDTVKHAIAAVDITGQAQRRRVSHARAQLDAVVIRQIEIGVETREISEPAPRPGLGVVCAIVFLTDFVVSSQSRAQKERSWKQVVHLHAVRLSFAAYHSFHRERLVDEGQLVLMNFGKATEVGKETAPLGRQIPGERGCNCRRFVHFHIVGRSIYKAVHPGKWIDGSRKADFRAAEVEITSRLRPMRNVGIKNHADSGIERRRRALHRLDRFFHLTDSGGIRGSLFFQLVDALQGFLQLLLHVLDHGPQRVHFGTLSQTQYRDKQ